MQTSQQGMANQVLAREPRSSEKRILCDGWSGTIVAGYTFRAINSHRSTGQRGTQVLLIFFRQRSMLVWLAIYLYYLYCARHFCSHSFPLSATCLPGIYGTMFFSLSHISFRLLDQIRELKRAKTDMPLNAKGTALPATVLALIVSLKVSEWVSEVGFMKTGMGLWWWWWWLWYISTMKKELVWCLRDWVESGWFYWFPHTFFFFPPYALGRGFSVDEKRRGEERERFGRGRKSGSNAVTP